MDSLILGPGGSLIWRDLHRQDAAGPVSRQVAPDAMAYRFEPVALRG